MAEDSGLQGRASRPLFSVITPVYNPDVKGLRASIASVCSQTMTDWELILIDDASPDDRVREVLREAAASDERIKLIERATNGHIVAASNDGIDLAGGEFLALLDHDDQLEPHAFSTMAAAIVEWPDVDYLYSDEDKINEAGASFDVFSKPIWSPERLRSQMYTGHLSVLRTSLVRAVGGFHAGFDGSQDHDLVLRVTERARRVVAVPEVLYHWRAMAGSTALDVAAKPYAWEAGVRAVQAHVERMGIDATVEPGREFGTYRVRRQVPGHRRISVVIPTRGSTSLVWGEWRCLVLEAVRSMVAQEDRLDVQYVVVHDDATDPRVLAELEAIVGPSLVLVPYAAQFNFSQKCNLGALAGDGDLVAFINDDVELISPDFFTSLCGPLEDPQVGITGAKLLYADSTIQHAGLAFRAHDFYHAYRGVPTTEPGPFNALVVNRECSGLTAAAVAMRREVFDAVGGFSEALPINFNDVDMSLKVRGLGLSCLWLHDAEAFHFESRTRTPVVHAWEHNVMSIRWGSHREDSFLMRDVARRSRLRKRDAAAARTDGGDDSDRSVPHP